MSVEKRTAKSSEVAAALHMSPASVQAYARRGRIPYRMTPGGHYRFDVAEVVALLDPPLLSVSDDLVDLDLAGPVVVDELSGFRRDPISKDAESRLRSRGHRDAPRPGSLTEEECQGARELDGLIRSSGGAAVAVLHR